MKRSPIEKRFEPALAAACETLGWTLASEVRVGKYTIDYLITTQSGIALIVEADGAKWHERTEDQGLKDRERDRWFLWSYGIPTVRFMGSEILKDVDACMTKVVQCASSLAKGQRRIPHVVQRHLAAHEEVVAFVEKMAETDEPDLSAWKFNPEEDIAR